MGYLFTAQQKDNFLYITDSTNLSVLVLQKNVVIGNRSCTLLNVFMFVLLFAKHAKHPHTEGICLQGYITKEMVYVF